jgi:hypothetical protein
LTYTFTRLARCWLAVTRCGRVGIFPRRNRCFHSSIDKVASRKRRGARSRGPESSLGLVTTIARTTNSGLPAKSGKFTSHPQGGQPSAA